ncbi:hypothetical protein ACVW0K_000341 [Streptomyces filamentosus]|uniref:hypothetical protein n=1 Tax=Streptomyces filamentosus TaxID=67294 RepID=UPI0033D382AF
MESSSGDNVLLLAFPDPERCGAAFREAQSLPGYRQEASVARRTDGELEVLDTHVRGTGAATVGGGAAGLALGLLGGPVGALLGFTAGALLGNAAEQYNLEAGGEALITLSTRVPDGGAMLVLHLHERSPGPADELAARHGASVERLSAGELDAEIEDLKRRSDADGPAGE